MFVFRVENNDCVGPFNPTINSDICGIFIWHLPPQDMGHSPISEHYFAWSSLKHFKRMLNNYCANQFKNDDDWQMSIYEVNEKNVTFLPDGQAMFIKNRSRLIQRVKFGNINRLRKYK